LSTCPGSSARHSGVITVAGSDHTFRRGLQLHRLVAVLGLLALGLVSRSQAQETQDASPPLHWSFAAVFGSGYYRIGDNDIYVLRFPLAGEIARSEDGRKQLRWLLPVSVGSVQFREFFDSGTLPTQIGLLTALPGLRLDYQLNESWRVSPSVFIGHGWARDVANATIFGGGVSGLRPFSLGAADLALGLSADYYRYSSSGDGEDDMTRLGAGLDLVAPLPMDVGGRKLYFKGYALYYRYEAQLAAPFYTRLDTLPRAEMLYEWSISVAFGFREPMQVLGLGLDRIGLSISGTDLGGAFAIKLVASFPF